VAIERLIEAESAGERLDILLAEMLGSRSRAQRMIVEGRVLVDGATVRKNHRVAGGERVAIDERPPAAEAPDADAPVADFGVSYEDEHLIVVDKPAGVVVHPARGHREGTLAQALTDRAAGGAVGECLRERSLAVPAGRMHHDARRLVDDDEVLVLVADAEVGDGRVGVRRLGGRRPLVDRDPLAACDAVVLAHGGAVHQHAALHDHPLRPRPRAEHLGQQDVQPLAGGLSFDEPLDRHVRSPPGERRRRS